MKRKLSVVALCCLLVVGCTSAQWFALVKALLPLATDIAIQFSTFANKGTVPAAEVAQIQKYSGDVQTLFGEIGVDVTAWQTDKNPSRLEHISVLLSQIKTQSADLLNTLQFKDHNTQAFIVAIIQDAVDLAGLIPVVVTPVPPAKGSTEIQMRTSLPKAQALKAVFKFRLANLPK